MTGAQNEVVAENYTASGSASWSLGQEVRTTLISRNGLLHMGLKHLLADTCFAVADTTCDLTDLLAFAQTGPSLLILDASYGAGQTSDMIRHVKQHCPAARLVVLADHFSSQDVLAYHAAGADGLCLTTTPREVLITSLELIMLGQPVVPPTLVLTLVQDLSDRLEQRSHDSRTAPSRYTPDPKARKLSSREADILRCLTEGAPNKVIARKLDVAEATVKVHVKAILRKIGAGNRTQAAIWATEHMPPVHRPSAHP